MLVTPHLNNFVKNMEGKKRILLLGKNWLPKNKTSWSMKVKFQLLSKFLKFQSKQNTKL